MPRTYTISKYEAKEIRERMKKCDAKAYRKLEAVALRGEGMSNSEVARITKYHPDWVSRLVSQYRNKGIEAIAKDGRKGGNHRNLSHEEERKILEGFKVNASLGQVITPREIKKKYDEAAGHETKTTFIYKVLKRHGWRKVMPRSRHPKKATAAEIEASKKLTINTKA